MSGSGRTRDWSGSGKMRSFLEMADSKHTFLAPGTEFDMVRALWGRIGDRAAPSGDDCAFVDVGETRLAISGDLSIEGTHFRLGWLALHEIGWRAAAASLSDLAAVAATPVGIMVGIVRGVEDEAVPHHRSPQISISPGQFF